MFTSQFRDEFLIGVRLRPTQLVIEMNNRKDNAKVSAQFQQQSQQRNRIDSAGNRHPDALSGAKQVVTPNVGMQALQDGVHRNMVPPRLA